MMSTMCAPKSLCFQPTAFVGGRAPIGKRTLQKRARLGRMTTHSTISHGVGGEHSTRLREHSTWFRENSTWFRLTSAWIRHTMAIKMCAGPLDADVYASPTERVTKEATPQLVANQSVGRTPDILRCALLITGTAVDGGFLALPNTTVSYIPQPKRERYWHV